MKICFQRLKRTTLSRLLSIDQQIPILVIAFLIISQKPVVCISASQNIPPVICDQILVVHPVIRPPGPEQINGIIKPGFHLLMGNQLLKMTAV